jgi:hypothetical protein
VMILIETQRQVLEYVSKNRILTLRIIAAYEVCLASHTVE